MGVMKTSHCNIYGSTVRVSCDPNLPSPWELIKNAETGAQYHICRMWAGSWREAKIYNFNKFHHDHLTSSLSFENHDHKYFSSKKGKITKRTSYFFLQGNNLNKIIQLN